MVTLNPAFGLPLGAVIFPLFAKGYGAPGFAQFRDEKEQGAFLAGLLAYQAAAFFAASHPLPGQDAPPQPALRDFFVVLYASGALVRQGSLAQLQGCPYPPWYYGGSGVPMRPATDSSGSTVSPPGVPGGASLLPPVPLVIYLAPQLAGGAWGAWLRVGPTSSEAITLAAAETARQAFKSCGVVAAVEARLRVSPAGVQLERAPGLVTL